MDGEPYSKVKLAVMFESTSAVLPAVHVSGWWSGGGGESDSSKQWQWGWKKKKSLMMMWLVKRFTIGTWQGNKKKNQNKFCVCLFISFFVCFRAMMKKQC